DAGQFVRQRQLCQAIIDPRCALEDETANPLTLRLAAARQSLTALEGLIDRTSGGLGEMRREAALHLGIPREKVELRAAPWAVPGGENLWISAAYAPAGGEGAEEREHRPYNPAEHAFPLMEAHGLLFRFFTGLSSALERVAREIDLMYRLNAPNATWRTFMAGHIQSKAFRALREKDPALSAWVSGLHAGRLAPVFGYLNVMESDGLLPVEVSIHSGALRWQMTTVNRPGQADSDGRLNVDVQQACRSLLGDALTMIDSVYYIMLYRLKTESPPPW
ncbi:MAG: hypothetical protein NTZ05_18995, partial [Chloroflexi bacterium]|nr:hypothetical protein [Chloroflexota bacterium]